jgi:hypothetical protein
MSLIWRQLPRTDGDWIVFMAPDHSGTTSWVLSCALSWAPSLERVDGTLVMHR